MPNINDFSPVLDIPKDKRFVIDQESGRIAIRIANWDDVHIGYDGKLRTPKNMNTDAAHVGEAVLDDGSVIKVANLPYGVMHADDSWDSVQAAAYYTNTDKSIARIRYSKDEIGIRADGLLYEDVPSSVVDRMLASAPSIDYRVYGTVRAVSDVENGYAELCGACLVNIPGNSYTYNSDTVSNLPIAASAATVFFVQADSSKDNIVSDSTDNTTKPECEGDNVCDSCTCGKKDQKPEGEQSSVTASGMVDMETPTEEVDEKSTEQELMKRIESMGERIAALEKFVVDSFYEE